jgi:hypothetical protein
MKGVFVIKGTSVIWGGRGDIDNVIVV